MFLDVTFIPDILRSNRMLDWAISCWCLVIQCMYTYHVNAIPAGFYDKNLITYFGKLFSITRERTEVIIQGTHDRPDNPNAAWREYEFKCKPGNVTRAPCLISPYHYRLDWLMWFSAFQVSVKSYLKTIILLNLYFTNLKNLNSLILKISLLS